MKKYFLMLIAASGALLTQAQEAGTKKEARTSVLPGLHLDLNVRAGVLQQDLELFDLAALYPNAVNANISNIGFANGTSYGADLQIGYFFGKSRHFGIGAGIMYLSQSADLTMDNFHIEYQRNDYNGDVYRQILHANNAIVEKVEMTNISIPLVLKYQGLFSNKVGFTVSAGVLYNLQMQNKYTTNAAFDYEAVYKLQINDDGSVVPVYDPNPIPGDNNWLITQEQFTTANPDGDVNAYFEEQRRLGYNVGLNQGPTNKSGETKYESGAFGFIVQPAISFMLSDKLALNVGGYYLSQTFTNQANNNYRLTDAVGSYQSMTGIIKTNTSSSYGGNLGVRYYLGRIADADGDRIPDKRDLCPDVAGIKAFKGCPDTDGDGIEDSKDACPTVAGLAEHNGCPDTDGDGTPDNSDQCVDIAGPADLNGCPDSDGDGVADRNDNCPDQPGVASLSGCPDSDGDGVADKDDACPDVAGKPTLNGCPDSDNDGIADKDDKCPDEPGTAENNGCPAPKLEEALRIEFQPYSTAVTGKTAQAVDQLVAEMKDNLNQMLYIEGHADISGNPQMNMQLSKQRAMSVKNYMVKKGISKDRIQADWFGDTKPAFPNNTYEGRAKNRRVVFRIIDL